MTTHNNSNLKSRHLLFGVLILFVIVTILPHALAITFTNADNPSGPLSGLGWAAGIATAGVAAGVGVWTATKRR
ncbi:MAG TPA: hypothetical protein VEJ68_02760 [Candidatus Bathyarchaeia archaeon]|nr:hypothetical protein [Candidatus Bathyarchaeia archaeon]